MKKIISFFKKTDITTISVFVCGFIGLVTFIACQIIYSPVAVV